MALTSEDAPFRQLEAYAKALRDAIERAPGVQQADVWGAPPAEVRVAANLDQLAAYRLPLSAVAEALQREGVDTPIGAVEAGGRRFNVQSSGSFNSLDEIRGVALRAEDGSLVTVGDVADVAWANDERAHITRYNGQRAVFVSARARLGENIFDVHRRRPRRASTRSTQSLPDNITLHRGFDQSETVKHRLGNLGARLRHRHRAGAADAAAARLPRLDRGDGVDPAVARDRRRRHPRARLFAEPALHRRASCWRWACWSMIQHRRHREHLPPPAPRHAARAKRRSPACRKSTSR